jgi:hypothetical protein
LDCGRFELLDGHRLVEAGRALGWAEVNLLLVNATVSEAALWSILINLRVGRYSWWEKVRAIRTLSKNGGPSLTGRAISCWTGWPESTISEYRTASAVITPELLARAEVNEERDSAQLMRLTRRDGRHIVSAETEEDVVLRLREALAGRTPTSRERADKLERGEGAVAIALSADGRWTAEVNLGEISLADLRTVQRHLIRQLGDAYDRLKWGKA